LRAPAIKKARRTLQAAASARKHIRIDAAGQKIEQSLAALRQAFPAGLYRR